jgi:hypothetical protein
VHLVLAPRRRLAELYGAGFPAIDAALADALAARTAAGVASLAYDPAEGLPGLGVAPAPLEPLALAAQLRAADDALARQGDIIESLWIVGGPAAVPFGSMPNPLPDSDEALLGDSVYGLADAVDLLARWPVGRTPDAEPPAAGTLAALLRRVAAAHRAGPRPLAEPLALAAARWAAVTAAVLERAGAAGATLLSPPLSAGDPALRRLAEARLIYGNLHGLRSSAAWLGQPASDSELVPVLRSADLAGLDLSGSAVISQACFGARLDPAPDGPALAPALLRAGADALVAPLGLSYGAIEPPPGDSDLLAAALIAALRTPGTRLGAAFLAAHAAYLRAVLTSRGRVGADDVKTMLGFVLYGDPALAWVNGSAPARMGDHD